MKPIHYATVRYERRIHSGEVDALWQVADSYQGLELITNAEMGLTSFGFEKEEKRENFTKDISTSQMFNDVVEIRLGQLR